jgi:hypothetical protein
MLTFILKHAAVYVYDALYVLYYYWVIEWELLSIGSSYVLLLLKCIEVFH